MRCKIDGSDFIKTSAVSLGDRRMIVPDTFEFREEVFTLLCCHYISKKKYKVHGGLVTMVQGSFDPNDMRD